MSCPSPTPTSTQYTTSTSLITSISIDTATFSLPGGITGQNPFSEVTRTITSTSLATSPISTFYTTPPCQTSQPPTSQQPESTRPTTSPTSQPQTTVPSTAQPVTFTSQSTSDGQVVVVTITSTPSAQPTISPGSDSNSDSSGSGGASDHVGAIVGGVVGGTALIVIIAILARWLVVRNRRDRDTQALNAFFGAGSGGGGLFGLSFGGKEEKPQRDEIEPEEDDYADAHTSPNHAQQQPQWGPGSHASEAAYGVGAAGVAGAAAHGGYGWGAHDAAYSGAAGAYNRSGHGHTSDGAHAQYAAYPNGASSADHRAASHGSPSATTAHAPPSTVEGAYPPSRYAFLDVGAGGVPAGAAAATSSETAAPPYAPASASASHSHTPSLSAAPSFNNNNKSGAGTATEGGASRDSGMQQQQGQQSPLQAYNTNMAKQTSQVLAGLPPSAPTSPKQSRSRPLSSSGAQRPAAAQEDDAETERVAAQLWGAHRGLRVANAEVGTP